MVFDKAMRLGRRFWTVFEWRKVSVKTPGKGQEKTIKKIYHRNW